MEERKQFTFYNSFFKAIKRIRKAADRAIAYDVVCDYALYGTEPDMDNLPESVAITFTLIRPNLDASRKKAKNGRAGGTAKQTASKAEANRKQTESKSQANDKQTASEKENEIENEIENEKENECLRKDKKKKFVPPTLEEVQRYCRERNNGVNAERFYDYFTESNWVDSKGQKVMNWKQRVISWERNTVTASPQRRGKLDFLTNEIRKDFENDSNRSETMCLLDERPVVEL